MRLAATGASVRRGRVPGAALWGLLCALETIGCSDDACRLYCGAGLRPPVAEAVLEFSRLEGVTIECDYRGSEVLLSTIELTREGDLYLPGDVHYVDLATAAGLVDTHRTVCYLVPVILVRKGNPKGISNVADLVNPALRVGLGDPEACAIGRKASRIFAKNGIDESALPVAIRTVTVNELANHVKLGSLDAAIVWDAVAAFDPSATEAVPIPTAANVISTVPVAVLRSARHPELANRFVEFLASARGQEIFAKHHYTVAPPQ